MPNDQQLDNSPETTLPPVTPAPVIPEFMKKGVSADPWQHRSQRMRCATCMWHAAKTDVVGRCRANPPSIKGYPVVYSKTDWCGGHKLDEAHA